jgi:Fic family protein
MKNRLGYRKSGTYRTIPKDQGKSRYTTFIPNPLSEDLDIEIDPQLANLMNMANRLLGQLEGMSAFLPNAAAIESVFMNKEALLSRWIDGSSTSLYSVFDISEKDKYKSRSVRDYAVAMRYGLDKTATSQYTNKLLCEIHGKLISPAACKDSGRFRKEQVFLSNCLTNTEQYNPAAPCDIAATMRDLEKFIQGNDNFDATIKASLAHYQFETIHPFMTGNGRIGRILTYLVLSRTKVLTRPIICLSQYLYLNKMEYIDRMERLRQIYAYEQWIKFFDL